MTSPTGTSAMPSTTLGSSTIPMTMLGLGAWSFGGSQWAGQDDDKSTAALQASFDAGVTHLDTARAYGNGKSEQVCAEFLKGKRDKVYVATKGNIGPEAKPEEIRAQLKASLKDLQTESVDLYYLHWPRTGKDLKPVMAELEKARGEGKIKAIGISNFTVEHMESIADVCTVDAHQLCYNAFWRPLEREVIPYCVENNIAVVTYSSIAQGILTGKFGHERPSFPEGDQRNGNTLFSDDAWPHIAKGVTAMKALAEKAGQPLVNLAVQWVASRPGVASILLGARDEAQAKANAATLAQPIDAGILDEFTAISDEACKGVPDTGNIFQYYP